MSLKKFSRWYHVEWGSVWFFYKPNNVYIRDPPTIFIQNFQVPHINQQAGSTRSLPFMISHFNYLKNFGLLENERLHPPPILLHLCITHSENLWHVGKNTFLIYSITFNITFKLVRRNSRLPSSNSHCKCIMLTFSAKEEIILEIIFFMHLCSNLPPRAQNWNQTVSLFLLVLNLS